MKVKVKNKRPLIAIAILLAVAGIGGTIAYHTSHGIFSNFFTTIFDQWTTTEEFVSPDNWQQCQIVPKTITATNSGNAAIGVRFKYEEYWKLINNNSDSHESDLPLQYGGQNVALVDLNTSHDWERRDDGYYYYTRPLEPGETTSSAIDYVEYNCNLAIIEENNDCETVNGSTTCTRDQFDYDNAKYHLFATVEITDQPETYNITKPTKATITYGSNINFKMKQIANPGTSFDNTGVADTAIRAIKMANALPSNFTPTSQNKFNYYNNEPEIRGWFENSTGTFYFYTEADYIETPADMRWTFQALKSLTDISGLANWHTHNTTQMSSIFSDNDSLSNLTPLANWETRKNTTFAWAFYETPSIINLDALRNWHTENVNSLQSMFYNSSYFIGNKLTNIDGIAGWNTSNVTNLGWLLYGNNLITNVNALRNWDTSKVTNMKSIFCGCTSLKDISGLADWDTGNVTDLSYAFYESWSLPNASALLNWDTHSVTTIYSLFSGTRTVEGNLADISGLANWNTSNITDMGWAFHGISATNVDALLNWNTSKVTNLDSTFMFMRYLKNVNGLRNWDTHAVTTFNSLFYYDNDLADISGLARWNTDSLVELHRFMSETAITNVDALLNWNVENVTSLDRAFGKATKLKNVNGLRNWNTRNVSILYSTFTETNSLEDISGLANWNTSNVTNIGWLFGNSQSKITSLSPLMNWDVRKVTDAASAFYAMGGHISSLDGLQNWKTNSLKDASWMFANNGNALTDISQIANWNLTNITNISRIFSGDSMANGSSLNGWVVPSGADTSYAFTGSDKPTWFQE